MSTQRFHFLTIVGRAASDVEAVGESLLAARVEDHPGGVGGTDYRRAAHARIERVCASLLAAADALPVLHHATQIDGWATGNHALARLPWPDGRVRAVMGLNYGFAFYPRSAAAAVYAGATRARRAAARRGRRLDSWYEDAVATAVASGQVFGVHFLVVAVAECLGGSRLDAEVYASTTAIIPGVPRRRHARRHDA